MNRTQINYRGDTINVEWWEQDDFKGRVFGLGESPDQMEYMPIADDDIGCDICSQDIVTFPVPVVDGYAYCPDCWSKVQGKGGAV